MIFYWVRTLDSSAETKKLKNDFITREVHHVRTGDDQILNSFGIRAIRLRLVRSCSNFGQLSDFQMQNVQIRNGI